MDQYIGKMLDNRYEILELIGSGGMANVYKAKCHRLNRMVAVKILKNDLAENADFRRRFRDESLAVAQLSHANIVSVYDVSRSGDTEYIVMELVDGITLKQYMERRGKMDWREALHFITQIMRALSHAHSRGIIHRADSGKIIAYRSGGGFGVRLDSGNAFTGSIITPYYDSLLVKATTYGLTHAQAVQKMLRELDEFRILGVKTNIGFLTNVLR